MADVRGLQRYVSDESTFKGDNNRFRLVWWYSVARETWYGNPALGLGFGHDLAHNFIQEYSPDASEEFTTRSPHNIFLSVFGRMGLVGLGIWCAFCAVLLRRTWRALRRDENRVQWGLWCSACVMLVSATFGVVLEGPMGAVPFWVVLGLVHGTKTATDSQADPGNSTRESIATLQVETPAV
jgi:O-antigen ligase